MGSGRDKRRKNNKTPGVGAAKTARKTELAEEKRNRRVEKAAQGDEDDIDAILAQISMKEAEKVKVEVEVGVPPPSARVNCTITASPSNQKESELYLFGGECTSLDGTKTRVFGDTFRFNCEKRVWTQIHSPNSPPPRSSHQAWVVGGFYYIFGGEFTSPNQERFHHFKDLWRFDLSTNEWEQLQLKGSPSVRSGHRVAVYKHKVILFGGFYDNGKDVKYYNDMYELDLDALTWTPLGKPGEVMPPPRSACQLAVFESTMFLYGGYCKRREDDGVGVGVMEKGTVLTDFWALDLKKYTWEKIKRTGVPPGPRAGFSMAVHHKQAVVFGGCVDHEKDRGEIIVSEFYNEMYAFKMDTRRWFPLVMRAPPAAKGKGASEASSSQSEGALLQQVGDKKEDAAATKIQAHFRGHIVRKAVRLYRIGGIVSECLYSPGSGLRPPKNERRPIGRINAAMTTRGNTLWLFGGLLEIGDNEIALDDMWSLDLSKMNKWVCEKELTTLPDDLKPTVSSDDDDSEDEDDENKGED